ncbi:MAG: ABC transporter ATP-binding protein, partial [Acidimicrobiia bacterium]
MPPLVRIEGITFSYGQTVALQDVTAVIPTGVTGLVGANGAGKTTLLRILLGILTPAAGVASVLDVAVTSNPMPVRRRVGFMPETKCLPLDQSAADFVAYSAELAGLPVGMARRRASDVLGLVGLDEERFRPISGFSTGMRQRAKLAQALVHDPELVFLDEPTAGLDPEGREEMLDLIGRLSGFGVSVLVSSHVLTDIEQTCNWVVMLDGGRVLREGPIAGFERPDVVEIEVIGDPAAVAAELEKSGLAVEVDGDRLTISGVDPFHAVRNA